MNKKYERIKSVAVYCGSRTPMDEAYEEAAVGLAKFIAAHGMTLVFGASNVGTMKTVADAALAAGGKVVGVFTTNLPMSLAHPGLTELVVTHSLAERKREMIERADALVALPGGLGTLDELFDALALRRVKNGGHKKPVDLLINVCPEERMMCYKLESIVDIVMYFCETGARDPMYDWIKEEF